mgnify:CR=1 FL=1
MQGTRNVWYGLFKVEIRKNDHAHANTPHGSIIIAHFAKAKIWQLLEGEQYYSHNVNDIHKIGIGMWLNWASLLCLSRIPLHYYSHFHTTLWKYLIFFIIISIQYSHYSPLIYYLYLPSLSIGIIIHWLCKYQSTLGPLITNTFGHKQPSVITMYDMLHLLIFKPY